MPPAATQTCRPRTRGYRPLSVPACLVVSVVFRLNERPLLMQIAQMHRRETTTSVLLGSLVGTERSDRGYGLRYGMDIRWLGFRAITRYTTRDGRRYTTPQCWPLTPRHKCTQCTAMTKRPCKPRDSTISYLLELSRVIRHALIVPCVTPQLGILRDCMCIYWYTFGK